MPVERSGYIQSVELDSAMYIAGGNTHYFEDEYIVVVYSTEGSQWNVLPAYKNKWFTMTTIRNKLVLVGGRDKFGKANNELGEWQPDSNQWTHPFPSMSIPRYYHSVTSHKHWLIVAGGYHFYSIDSVEILDVSNMQWSTGPSTPTPWYKMKSTAIGDTWYLMGGYCSAAGWNPDVYSVSLESIISSSTLDEANVWTKLPSLNCTDSCPLNLRGSLLAVGGIKSTKRVSTMQHFVPETNTWVKAGKLPHAVCNCTCIVIPNQIYVIGGSDGKRRLDELFMAIL